MSKVEPMTTATLAPDRPAHPPTLPGTAHLDRPQEPLAAFRVESLKGAKVKAADGGVAAPRAVPNARVTATIVAGRQNQVSNVTPPGTTVKVNKDEAVALRATGHITGGPLSVGIPGGDYELLNAQAFTIAGAGFGVQGANSQVMIGAVAQTITAWSNNSITCTAVQGANVAGTAYPLTVRNHAMQTSTMPQQVTFVAAVVVPGAPTGAAAADIGGGVVRVSCVPPASDGGDAITAYECVASPGGVTGATVDPTFIAMNVGVGWTGTFTVKARNSAGLSAASAATNSVTTA